MHCGRSGPQVVDLNQSWFLLQPPSQVIHVGFDGKTQHDDQRKSQRLTVQGGDRDNHQDGVKDCGGTGTNHYYWLASLSLIVPACYRRRKKPSVPGPP